jgi:hypothetical protein
MATTSPHPVHRRVRPYRPLTDDEILGLDASADSRSADGSPANFADAREIDPASTKEEMPIINEPSSPL